MNLRQRLSQLERTFAKRGACPVCKDGKTQEVVEVRAIFGDDGKVHGHEPPPPATPCPHCGRKRRQIAIVKYA